MCKLSLNTLTACKVSNQIWASSTSASSEDRPKATGRGFHWPESLAICGDHLDVLKNTKPWSHVQRFLIELIWVQTGHQDSDKHDRGL